MYKCFVALVLGCAFSASAQTYRVSYSPYHNVNWETDHQCLSQHHDHPGDNESKIRLYDDAGYDAVSVMHYSGVKSAGYGWTERHWPLSDYLPNYDTDQEFLDTCQNLKILIPNAEEFGDHHITSPFLTEYIAKWEPKEYEQREDWHYDSTQECLNKINQFGGLAFIAHPWGNPQEQYLQYENFAGIEIRSGFAAYKFASDQWSDRNIKLLEVWDMLLEQKSTHIWGISVNDWYGPLWTEREEWPEVADSSKIITLIPEWNLEAYRTSIENGALFAVKDIGIVKGQYPVVNNISVSPESISITTDGDVKWISGEISIDNPILDLSSLPDGLNYVRAEISNEFGTLYVQPFSLTTTSLNDSDNDGDVDLNDFSGFQACFNQISAPCLSLYDSDSDRDVDADDFEMFVSLFSGP